MEVDFTYGIKDLWNSDPDYQQDCIYGIIRNIRGIEDDTVSKLHAEYLMQQGAFFVHNHEYMKEHFGAVIADPKYGVYTPTGYCHLAGRLAIPIRLFDGSVHGFIGYSNKPANYNPEDVFIKYLYPPKFAFNKSRYFYLTAEEYQKAVQDGYICIVDGIFDKIILQCMGIHAVSLCGSALTIWHRRYLSFIKHKIVIADNDDAGRKLASFCKYSLEGCVELIQSSTGDVDSLVRSKEELNRLKSVFEEMQHEGFLISKSLTTAFGGAHDS